MSDLDFDVLVVGGGATGVTAAIAAARGGARTALMDIRTFVGGNAASGLVIHTYKTRNGKQIAGGIAQEYIDRLIADGGAVGHVPYGARVHSITPVDADRFRIMATKMLDEAGVTVLYSVAAIGVEKSGDRVTGVRVAMKGQLVTINARLIVDASGDADVAAAAGADFRKGDEAHGGAMMPVSMVLRCYGTDGARAADAVSPGKARAIARRPEYEKPFPVYFSGDFGPWNDVLREKGLFPHDNHKATFNSVWPDELNINTSFMLGVDATDSRALANATVKLTERTAEVGRFLKEHVPGFENSRFIPAAFVGVRETRVVKGIYEVSDEDAIEGRNDPKSTIGLACFPIDIHDPVTGIPSFVEIGGEGYFGMGYGSLVVDGIDNMFVAGRCMSSSRKANGSIRNMAACMVSGQAAGTAAAMCVSRNAGPAEIEVAALQDRLIKDGAYLGG